MDGTTFTRAFDRVIGIDERDAPLREDLLDTAMLQPFGFVTAGLGFLVMTAAAFWTLRTAWSAAWLCLDASLLTLRVVPALGPWRAGMRLGPNAARTILTTASVMFAIFGLGCAASFRSGDPQLSVASGIAVMGLLTGLATRWAGLPRLAITMIVLVSLPMAFCLATVYTIAGLFVVLAAGSAALTMQNNRTLLAMLRAERNARRLTGVDHLTGLLNRAGLDQALAEREGSNVAIVYMDLDGFKAINDRHGHAAGDRVLREVGARFRSLRDDAVVARLGGDEFLAILPEGEDAGASFGMLARMSLEAPIALSDGVNEIRIDVSCGCTSGEIGTAGAAALLERADQKLYAVKRARAGRHAVVDVVRPARRGMAIG